jgi:hypothetical protein
VLVIDEGDPQPGKAAGSDDDLGDMLREMRVLRRNM